MKKLLAVFAIYASTLSSGALVVSCMKPPKNVILTVDASVTSSKTILNGYKDLVDDFNEKNSDSSIKVQLNIAAAGAIQNAIFSSEYLPDLYLTYPDNVTRYLDLISDDVVELNSDYYGEFTPELDSFLQEGQINGKQYVLPMSKSFDVTNVNLRLLKELCNIVLGQDPTSNFWTKVWSETSNDDITAGGVKSASLYSGSELQSKALLNVQSSATELFNKIAGAKDADELRNILQVDDNDVIISNVMWNLKDSINTSVLQDTDKVFTLGIDDLPNKIYSQYGENTLSNSLESTQIKTLSENSSFFYNYYDNQFKINDINGMSGINDQLSFLQKLQSIKGKDKALITADKVKDEKADILYAYDATTTGSKIYSSNYFAQGTMLMAAGSTAGSFYYTSKKDKTKPDVALTNKDILTIATQTKGGKSYIVQQGPGIAAFKSSSDEKTQVVKKFLKFLMQPEQQAMFAIKTGYMPSNEASYDKTDYKKWLSGEEKVDIYNNGKPTSRQNLILKQVCHMIENKNQYHFVTIEGSPMGTSIREKVILSQIQSIMLREINADLSEVKSKKSKQSVAFWDSIDATLDSIFTDLVPEGITSYESDLSINFKNTKKKIKGGQEW